MQFKLSEIELVSGSFFKESNSRTESLVSIMFIHSHNLFGRNSGNKEILHFCFKIQSVSSWERTPDAVRVVVHVDLRCPCLLSTSNSQRLTLTTALPAQLLHRTWRHRGLHPSNGLRRARRQLKRWSPNLCLSITSKQTENYQSYKLWSTY